MAWRDKKVELVASWQIIPLWLEAAKDCRPVDSDASHSKFLSTSRWVFFRFPDWELEHRHNQLRRFTVKCQYKILSQNWQTRKKRQCLRTELQISRWQREICSILPWQFNISQFFLSLHRVLWNLYIIHPPTNALLLNLEKFKIYIKIHIHIAGWSKTETCGIDIYVYFNVNFKLFQV